MVSGGDYLDMRGIASTEWADCSYGKKTGIVPLILARYLNAGHTRRPFTLNPPSHHRISRLDNNHAETSRFSMMI